MDALRFCRRYVRARVFLSAFALVAPSFTGCAGVWDDISSRDFSIKEWYAPPDPLQVLKNSTDGDKRAVAFRSLREPKLNGGSDADQDAIMAILTTAVETERTALCRLAAIEALQGFKDPRAVVALEKAYYRAGSFPTDSATIIKCRAIAALGETGRPEAVKLLVRVVNQPPVAVDGSEVERQQRSDERIAAARALGQFKGRQPAEALVTVLRSDPDVALKARAVESLHACTGRDFPADPQQWTEYLNNAGRDQPVVAVPEKTFGDKIAEVICPLAGASDVTPEPSVLTLGVNAAGGPVHAEG